MTCFVYKNELINLPQTSRQATSVALQSVATSSQQINQNVLDVVANSDAATAANSEQEAAAVRVAKKRGRPPKQAATQQPPSSTEIDNVPIIIASSQPIPRYNLRSRQQQ